VSRGPSPRSVLVVAAVAVTLAFWVRPPAASAFDPVKPLCTAAGLVSGIVGKACGLADHAGRILDAGKKLATGHLGSAAKSLLGTGSAAAQATRAVGLAAVGTWVIGGASFALRETARLMASTTNPDLASTWFSSAYWRMAAIAALLTLPFLFAAAVQALMRSDLALLARAALGYLPLSMLAVGIAAPVTTLLLASSDGMSAAISSAAGNSGGHFLERAGLQLAGLAAISRSPFIAFLVGLFTAAGTLTLWFELLMRDAAVYVIVLMLPVLFAALVWPARRVWAIRATELLVALILSKFAIVAVLALGGAALSHGAGGLAGLLAGLVLVMLGAFAPWALLRLLPLHELASGAVGSLRGEARPAMRAGTLSEIVADDGDHWIRSLHSRMSREAETTGGIAPSRGAARTEIEQLASAGQRTPDEAGPSAPGETLGPPATPDATAPAPAEALTAPAPAEAPAAPEPEILELGPEGRWCRFQPPSDEPPGDAA